MKMCIDIISEDKYFGLGLQYFLLVYNKNSFFEFDFDTVLDTGCDSIFLMKRDEIYEHNNPFVSFCRTKKVVVSKSSSLKDIHNLILGYKWIHEKEKRGLSNSEFNTLFSLFNGTTPKEIE